MREPPPSMLTIRDAQMASFEREMLSRFARRVVARAVVERPAITTLADADELERRAVDAVRRAEALGVRAEWDLYRYARCEMQYGPAFEERPGFEEARDIVADRGASWSVRLRRLDDWTRRHAEARAAR